MEQQQRHNNQNYKNNHRIQMVVTDLDGTLLSPDKTISTEAIQLVKKLQEHNIKFTFVTGRPPYAIQRFANQLAISAPIISCNGAIIYDHKTNKIMSATALDIDKLTSFLQGAAVKGLTVLILAGTVEYALTETTWTEKRKRDGRCVPISSLENIINSGKPIYKANIMSMEKEAEFLSLLHQIEALQREYSIAIYGNTGCEIVATGVNKRQGLIELCQLCGVSTDAVLAIGDNANDNEMLEVAGIGAVVANGTLATKEFADYHCQESYTKGVVEAINKFLEWEAN